MGKKQISLVHMVADMVAVDQERRDTQLHNEET
jgi:hypothetical protein